MIETCNCFLLLYYSGLQNMKNMKRWRDLRTVSGHCAIITLPNSLFGQLNHLQIEVSTCALRTFAAASFLHLSKNFFLSVSITFLVSVFLTQHHTHCHDVSAISLNCFTYLFHFTLWIISQKQIELVFLLYC